MAAGDRTAELKIKATLEGTEKGAGQVANLTDNVKQLGDAAAGTAGDLARESSALDDTSASIQKSTQEAQEARQAQEAMGAAGSAAGGEIAAGAEKGASATRELAQEADRTEEQAKKSAAAIQQFVSALTGRIAAEIAEMRQAGAPLEQIRAAYVGFAGEIRAMAGEFESAGVNAKTGNEAIETALKSVTAEVEKVDAEITALANQTLPTLSDRAREALGTLRGETITAEDALIAAATQIRRVDEELRETGRIGPRAINNVTQAVENYRGVIIASRGSIEAARTEEIATLRILETELERVTVTANRLTNASKDQREALKETGFRIAGVALAAQDFGRIFGQNGQIIGNHIAQLGILAANYEQAKDAIHGMNLNTIQMNTLGTAAAVQYAAVAAALLGGAAAGKAFSETSDANAESIRDLFKATKELFTVDLATRFAAGQDAANRYRGGLISLEEFENQRSIGLRRGEAAQLAYNAAVRDGIAPEIAYALAIEKTSKIGEFYAESLKAGDEGNRIWREGLALSGAEVAKLNAFLETNRERLAAAGLAEQTVRAAVEAETKARKDLNRELEAINQLLPEQAKNIPALIALADAIEKTAGNVKTLSAAERERISLIADLLRRGKDLSEEQRRVVALMLDEARAGAAVNTTLITLTRTRIDYTEALKQAADAHRANANVAVTAIAQAEKLESAENGVTQSIIGLLSNLERYIAAGPKASAEAGLLASALRQVLTQTKDLLPVERANLEAVAALAEKNGTLTKSEREYAQSLIATILAGKSATAQAAQQLAAYVALKTATTALASVANDLATAKDKESAGIKAAVAAAEAQLLANKNLEPGERVKYLQIIETGKQLIDLAESYKKAQESEAARVESTDAVVQSEAERQDALRSELELIREKIALAEKELGVNTEQNETRRTTIADLQWLRAQEQQLLDQQQEIIIVSSGRKAAMQQEIVEKARLLESLQKETAAVNQVTTSTNQLVISGKDAQGQWERGKIAISNLSEEERKAAEQAAALARGTREVGEAADEAVEPVRKLGGVHGETQEQVLKNLEAQRTAVAETTRVFVDLPTHLEKASGRMTVALGSADTALDTTAQKVRDLEALVGTLASKVDNELTAAINKMADAANRAAGEGGSSKFGDTLVAPQ